MSDAVITCEDLVVGYGGQPLLPPSREREGAAAVELPKTRVHKCCNPLSAAPRTARAAASSARSAQSISAEGRDEGTGKGWTGIDHDSVVLFMFHPGLALCQAACTSLDKPAWVPAARPCPFGA